MSASRPALRGAPFLALIALAPTRTLAESDAGAGAARLRANVVCDQPAAPGRLRCDVEARALGTLRWADVEIVHVPGFLVPLRARLGPRDATSHEEDLWHWSAAIVARDTGDGDVTVRVRAVICQADLCVPEEVVVPGHVKVGT